MEADIALMAHFKNEQMRDLAEHFLNGDSRPVFEEDVDEKHRPFFLLYQDIEIPEGLFKNNAKDLAVTWFSGLEFDLDHLSLVSEALFKCDCLLLTGIVLNDGYPVYRFQRSLKSNQVLTSYIDEDSEEYEQLLDVDDEGQGDLISMIADSFDSMIEEVQT